MVLRNPNNTKTIIVVTVIRIVPVAIRDAAIVIIVVPRPAAQRAFFTHSITNIAFFQKYARPLRGFF